MQTRAAQIGAGHAGIDEVRRFEVGALQIDSVEGRLGQHHAAQAGPPAARTPLEPGAMSFEHTAQRGYAKTQPDWL